jgi:tetratricopeptide (TPR) repeat protein
VLLAIGRLRSRQGRHDEALHCCEKALPLFLGVVYRDWARFDQAVACYRDVLLVCTALGDERMEASTYHNLGIAVREQGHLQTALECFDRCLSVFVRYRDHVGRARALHSRGVALRYLGRPEFKGHRSGMPSGVFCLRLDGQAAPVRQPWPSLSRPDRN